MKKINFLKIALIASLLALAVMLAVSCNFGSDEPDESDIKCASHQASDWIIDKEPGCAEAGSKHKECTLCGEIIETEIIETLDHTEVVIEAKAATCTETGLTNGKKCSVCNKVLVEQTTVATIPHTEQIVEGKAATCTETGLTDGKNCSVCSTVLIAQDTIPALDHEAGDWIIDLPASIGIDGKKHKECIRCQEKLEEATIPAIEETHVHEGATWVITKPATCKEDGSKAFICVCGHAMETQVIAKSTEHTEVTVLGKAATCTSTGLTEGKKCSVCGIVIVKQTPTALTGHTEEIVLGKAATCTETGTTDGKKCTVCGVTTVTQIAVAPKGHTFVGGVCTTCGFKGNYGVWITDGLGMPLTNIIVNIKQDGETVKMIQYKGQYVTFDLEDGEYTVELDLSGLDTEYVYDDSACVLSPDKKSLSIELYRTTSDPEDIYVGYPIDQDYTATNTYGVGSYKVSLTPNDLTFIIFTPKTPAIYTITYECESALSISYHGGTFFVQGNDVSKDNFEFSTYENGLAFNVYSSTIGNSYVFAIKSTDATECVLNIQNAGDPGTRLEDTPWTPYQEDTAKIEEMKNYPQEGTYTVIDLGDTSISAVLNPADGYYHLNSVDGPVIFIDLTSESQYIASIYTICSNQRMGTYVYDADGNVVEKRSYNELFFQCGMPDPSKAESTPSPGLRVPLTEKLAEAIQTFGNNQGWWKEGSSSNLFETAFAGLPYNQKYAWLLYCGYYK